MFAICFGVLLYVNMLISSIRGFLVHSCKMVVVVSSALAMAILIVGVMVARYRLAPNVITRVAAVGALMRISRIIVCTDSQNALIKYNAKGSFCSITASIPGMISIAPSAIKAIDLVSIACVF